METLVNKLVMQIAKKSLHLTSLLNDLPLDLVENIYYTHLELVHPPKIDGTGVQYQRSGIGAKTPLTIFVNGRQIHAKRSQL